jgi:hypothetical protein
LRRIAALLASSLLVPLAAIACSLAIPYSEYDSAEAEAATCDAPYDGPSYVDTVTPDAPLVYLRLDDTASPPDIRGSHIVGGASFGSGVTYGVPGALVHECNAAVAVDGTSFAVDLTNDEVFSFPGNSPYTFEVWVLPDGRAVQDDETLYHAFWTRNQQADAGSPRVAYVAGLIGVEVYADRIIDGRDSAYAYFNTASTESNVWHHVAVTFDGVNHLLYWDGALQATKTWDAGLDFAYAVDLLVGGQATDSSGDQKTFFVGSMDEFAVYDHALTADRIACHYAVGAGLSLPAGCGS